ncbi:hypothetical protein [Lentilactobacillus senioris]|uniref:hypothetical protein n=1 Tax=Lentilactobacillus senioris TaxID=931534 RepID=UPI000B117F97|nr:hypothetical protein [Lentilactobacillus senioris]
MENENSRVDLHANGVKAKKARYITGIDGIRTLAVLGGSFSIIYYHFQFQVVLLGYQSSLLFLGI